MPDPSMLTDALVTLMTAEPSSLMEESLTFAASNVPCSQLLASPRTVTFRVSNPETVAAPVVVDVSRTTSSVSVPSPPLMASPVLKVTRVGVLYE